MAPDDKNIGATVNQITERATLIVREEIELAKAEVEQKVKSLIRGAAIGAAAGFFALMGLVLLLHGLAWIFYLNVFDDPFWGFLIVAGVLFLLGGLAGWLAAKAFKKGTPPTPQMAIDEAKLIRQTVEASAGRGAGASAPSATLETPSAAQPPTGGATALSSAEERS